MDLKTYKGGLDTFFLERAGFSERPRSEQTIWVAENKNSGFGEMERGSTRGTGVWTKTNFDWNL